MIAGIDPEAPGKELITFIFVERIQPMSAVAQVHCEHRDRARVPLHHHKWTGCSTRYASEADAAIEAPWQRAVARIPTYLSPGFNSSTVAPRLA